MLFHVNEREPARRHEPRTRRQPKFESPGAAPAAEGKWHLWRIARLRQLQRVRCRQRAGDDLLMQLPLALAIKWMHCAGTRRRSPDSRWTHFIPNNYKMRIAPCPSDCPWTAHLLVSRRSQRQRRRSDKRQPTHQTPDLPNPAVGDHIRRPGSHPRRVLGGGSALPLNELANTRETGFLLAPGLGLEHYLDLLMDAAGEEAPLMITYWG